jgi:acetate kinase
MKIAVINAGSSSLKVKIFDMKRVKEVEHFLVEHIAQEGAFYKTHREALESLVIDFNVLDVVGHRVVHGGELYKNATLIDAKVMEDIEALSTLAPLHNPANLEGIRVAKEAAPHLPHIAIFDTAFHSTMPKEAYLYALPMKLYEKHKIRRYGFHGTSHSFLCKEAASLLGKKSDEVNLISLHLGNGASACAIKNGKSIDTSMGFTPLEGLVMGTRSGDIDPAIVLYLQKELLMNEEEVNNLLNHESGLLGVCEDNDVREIIKRKDDKAKLAVDMMVRRIQKYIGSYMILLENVDAIVFSGGIGENSTYIRERILDNKILKEIKSLTIKTNEELEIALECMKFV